MLVLISVGFYDAISSKKVLVVIALLIISIDNISEKRKAVFSFKIICIPGTRIEHNKTIILQLELGWSQV